MPLVVLLSGKDHIGAPTRQLRALLEEADIVRLHAFQLGSEAGSERRRVGKPAEAGECGELVGVLRQPLRLLVAEHLQPVLDVAQEAVGRIEVVSAHRRRSRRGALRAPAQGGSRQRAGRLAPASDQLLGLGEELDLPDAAAPDLDVVSGHGDLAEAAHGVDLPLHGVNVGDGGEIQVLAPMKGASPARKLSPGGDVARDRPGLDERGALPVLAYGLVVVERGIGGDGERRGARSGRRRRSVRNT